MQINSHAVYKRMVALFRNPDSFKENRYILDLKMMDYVYQNIGNLLSKRKYTFHSINSDSDEIEKRIMRPLIDGVLEKNPILPTCFPVLKTKIKPIVFEVLKDLGFEKDIEIELLIAIIKTPNARIITDDPEFLTKMYNLDFYGFITSKQFIDDV